ncbi:MAG: Phosphate acetyltransferase [Candidatus Heimdallarchaeota archaeon LC_2]|nr:MAG: Phosphate acetyltransferase [Candidatus Heimdallarchaeota archaeon LC_2]
MKKNLLITSLSPGTGKTTFTIALAQKFRLDGLNVGYFKPITDRTEDTDAANAKAVLGLDDDLSVICPVLITNYEYDMEESQKDEITDKISKAYKQLKDKYDFLIIESCQTVNHLAFLSYSAPHLAILLNAKIIMIASGRTIDEADSIVLMAKFIESFEAEIIGGVLTQVPGEFIEYFRTIICPTLLQKHQITMLGLVPDRPDLVAPTVAEVSNVVGGKIIAGKNYVNKLVETYMVGAMTPETALKYFRSAVNKAVITGGDRPQLAIAALETDTSVLILTGSIMPPAQVLAKAEDRQIPIMLVSGDTFSTIKTLTSVPIYGTVHSDKDEKLTAWIKFLDEVDCKSIIDSLKY